ncbi:MAG TPA: TonB-dependent receptor, partial [Flavobacterium sp.]
MNKKLLWVSAFVLATTGALAQEKEAAKDLDEVVISDSKFALAKEKSGKVIVKISKEDLEKRVGQSVATILNT